MSLPSDATKAEPQVAALVENNLSGENGKLDGSDDIMTELAVAPVSGKELSKLRGGFRTRSGLEISVGFDFKTFINGQLQVHNIFRPSPAQSASATGGGATKTFQIGALPTVIKTIAPAAAKPNPGPGLISSGFDPGPVATSSAQQGAAVPAPIVINKLTDGKITLVNLIGEGTKVTNSLDGGRANTVVSNSASGITIDTITSMSIDIVTPKNFVSSVRTGQFIGVGRDMSNAMRSALLGAIAR
ncbi:MAG: hypothetical protein OEQ29_20235 [Alphaproteobacteria bacterium]|nr:hypothetical protein [Alphaproteobacteria bacterium]